MQIENIYGAIWIAEYAVAMGYPSCCIKEFIQKNYNEDGYISEPRKLHSTGYVPCRKCNARYSKEELLNRIAERRECPIPFDKCCWIRGVHDEDYIPEDPEVTEVSYEGNIRVNKIIRKIKFTLH